MVATSDVVDVVDDDERSLHGGNSAVAVIDELPADPDPDAAADAVTETVPVPWQVTCHCERPPGPVVDGLGVPIITADFDDSVIATPLTPTLRIIPWLSTDS